MKRVESRFVGQGGCQHRAPLPLNVFPIFHQAEQTADYHYRRPSVRAAIIEIRAQHAKPTLSQPIGQNHLRKIPYRDLCGRRFQRYSLLLLYTRFSAWVLQVKRSPFRGRRVLERARQSPTPPWPSASRRAAGTGAARWPTGSPSASRPSTPWRALPRSRAP